MVRNVATLRGLSIQWMHRGFSILTRACVCNVSLMAKIYCLQVLHCACANSKIASGLSQVSLEAWFERMGRNTFLPSVKSGFLGITYLCIRQLITQFLFSRDDTYSFLRTVIQTHVGDHLPSFLVTSCKGNPIHPKGLLMEGIDAFRFLGVRLLHQS